MDLGISQRQVAGHLGANPWTYLLWEAGRSQPTARFVPGIISVLDHDPFRAGEDLGERLQSARRRLGLTQRQLAGLLGLSETSVYDAEHGRSGPSCPAVLEIARFLRLP